MPCYTVVQVEVKDKTMAEAALKQMKEKGTIKANANGTFTVTPANARASFADAFYKEYAAQVATRDAQKEGYYVNREEKDGEIHLTLRQY